MYLPVHNFNNSYKLPWLPPVSDYIAFSLSLDTPASLQHDSIDRLSGWLKSVVAAKIADCANLSLPSSSRYQVNQNTDQRFTSSPIVCIEYCSCIFYMFSFHRKLPRSLIVPSWSFAMRGITVESRISKLLVVPRQVLLVALKRVCRRQPHQCYFRFAVYTAILSGSSVSETCRRCAYFISSSLLVSSFGNLSIVQFWHFGAFA